MRNMRRKERFIKMMNRHCPFCESKTEPDYKDTATLEKYLTERGKIVSRSRSGVCSKHQRHLSRAIKQARHVALLPFVVRV